MKILYDHQVYSLLKYGGITRYFCELMKNLPAEYQFTLSLIFSDNYYLHDNKNIFKIIDLLPNKLFKGKHFIRERLYFLNQIYSKHNILLGNFDLFHPTFYDNYFLKLLKKPYIITVHDLNEFIFKDTYYYKHTSLMPQMEKVIRKANRIISISENTKLDIIKYFSIDPEKIDVIYHGFNRRVNTTIGKNKVVDAFGKYILFVGQRIQYKNFNFFAEAISKLLKRESELKLICVGTPFTKEENEFLLKLGILNQTYALNVDDGTLNELYTNALVFVYPSLYEGFGMPILEAYANNCPVCLSNSSCFPEIAQNAGVFFDPKNQDSILSAIEKVVYNNDYAKTIIKAGRNRLESFSWEKATKETISSYNKAI